MNTFVTLNFLRYKLQINKIFKRIRKKEKHDNISKLPTRLLQLINFSADI